jgi:hypothetical protein
MRFLAIGENLLSVRSFFYIIVLGLEKSNDFMVEWYGKRKLCYCSHHNVGKLSVSERYARETGREAIGNGLLLFPVSRSRIPKIPDFCEKRKENSQTRCTQTV